MKQYAVLLSSVLLLIVILFTGGCQSYLDKRKLSGLDTLVPDGAVVKENELPQKFYHAECFGASVVALEGEGDQPVKWKLEEIAVGEDIFPLNNMEPCDGDELLRKLLSYSKENNKDYLWVFSYVWSDQKNQIYYNVKPDRRKISRDDYDESWSDRLEFDEVTNSDAEYESSTRSTKPRRDGYLYPTADPADRVLNPIDNRQSYTRNNNFTRTVRVRGLLFDVESGEFILETEKKQDWYRPRKPPGYNAFLTLVLDYIILERNQNS